MKNFHNQAGVSLVSWLLMGGLILVALAVVLPLVTGEGPRENQFNGAGNQAADVLGEAGQTEVTVGDVVNNPALYVGQQVSLRAQVDDKLSENLFYLDGPVPLGEDLLVVVPRQAAGAPVSGDVLGVDYDTVEVTGEVRMMNLIEVEREFDLDLDPYMEIGLEDQRPVLLASRVTNIDE